MSQTGQLTQKSKRTNYPCRQTAGLTKQTFRELKNNLGLIKNDPVNRETEAIEVVRLLVKGLKSDESRSKEAD